MFTCNYFYKVINHLQQEPKFKKSLLTSHLSDIKGPSVNTLKPFDPTTSNHQHTPYLPPYHRPHQVGPTTPRQLFRLADFWVHLGDVQVVHLQVHLALSADKKLRKLHIQKQGRVFVMLSS